jgi:SAM-dependent methyltransferase
LGDLPNLDVLCLASGGGQQAPLLAAAGARVTSSDLSEEQLALDELAAHRESLSLNTVRGDMRDRGEDPVIRYPLPYYDKARLSPERYRKLIESGETLTFSHSLEEQIGGQTEAGFALFGLLEDGWKDCPLDP